MKTKNKIHPSHKTTESKVVFITGAATGIGLAAAKLLLSQGYKVTLFSLTKPEKKDLEILSQIPTALVLQGNICNPIQVQKALTQTIKKFGHLDVLINNAGISQKKLFKDTTSKEWDTIIDINIKGTLTVTHCALPFLKKEWLASPKHKQPHTAIALTVEQGGLIINISSGSALHAVSHLSIYSLTKAGILNFTQSIDKELQPLGIRAITITPGSTQTALFEKSSPRKTPLYQPEDIAQVIADTISGKQKPDKNRIVNPFRHLYK